MRPDDDLDSSDREFLERIAAPLRDPVELSDRVERKVIARLGPARVRGPAHRSVP
jgi:hypothetical protein